MQEARRRRWTRSPTSPDIEWHLIGPLQSNKAAIAAARFDWVHTVDRVRIAERLSAARPPDAPPLDVCVQVNISGEATKSGVAPDEAVALARDGRARCRGSGCAASWASPSPRRTWRRAARSSAMLRECFDACRAAGLAVDTLSMGMSADLEDAIAEGATLVRVGTAIFGRARRMSEAADAA